MAKKKTIKPMGTIGEIQEAITKEYGDSSLMTFEDGVVQNVDVVSTGSMLVDRAVGVGGLPRGRVVEVYGPESSGKTTLCSHVVANGQQQGLKCAFVDAEHALDPTYMEALNVKLYGNNRLMISQPDCGEDALDMTESLINCGTDIVVVDSVAALTPRAEIEGAMGDQHVGLQARLMSQALRKLTGLVRKRNTLLIFTNQIRHKIGVQFGSPETTSGGNALKFYASVRLEMRTYTPKDEDKNKLGEAVTRRVRVKVVKNKVAPPFKQSDTKIRFGKGFDRYGEILDLAIETGVIEKKGSWFNCGNENLGQGRDNTVQALIENPDWCTQIVGFIEEAEQEEVENDEERSGEEESDDEEIKAELKKVRKSLKKAKAARKTKRVKKLRKRIKHLKGQLDG